MNEITVVHREGDAFAVLVRDHVVPVDRPYPAGGLDTGPTPVELFVASLAACAVHYGRRYLRRRGLPADGLEITANFTMGADGPAKVTRVGLVVTPPMALRGAELEGFRDAVEHCTVHNSIIEPPQIGIDVVEAMPAAA